MKRFAIILVLFFLGGYLFSQLQTDTSKHFYAGELKYQWRKETITYSLKFSMDYNATYHFVDDQAFAIYLKHNSPFSYSSLKETDMRGPWGIFLVKNDTVFNPLDFFDIHYLDSIEYGHSEFDCNWFPNTDSIFLKNKWYSVTLASKRNIWNRFKGYQLLVIHNELNNDLTLKARLIFISKPLR